MILTLVFDLMKKTLLYAVLVSFYWIFVCFFFAFDFFHLNMWVVSCMYTFLVYFKWCSEELYHFSAINVWQTIDALLSDAFPFIITNRYLNLNHIPMHINDFVLRGKKTGGFYGFNQNAIIHEMKWNYNNRANTKKTQHSNRE